MMRNVTVFMIIVAAATLGACDKIKVPGKPTALSSFSGELKVAFLPPETRPDDSWRNARLLESFAFLDAKGRLWETPVDYVTDGASIPWALWGTGIAPFDGPYRDAAVLHDYYCDKHGAGRTWQEVQDMFLEASLARGTTEATAKRMYGAVLIGGYWNRCIWEAAVPAATVPATKADTSDLPARTAPPAPLPEGAQNTAPPAGEELDDLNEMEAWIRRENPSYEAIKQKALDLNRTHSIAEPSPPR